MSFLLVWPKKDHHVRTSSQDLLPDKDSPLTIIKFAFQTNLRFQSNNARFLPSDIWKEKVWLTGRIHHLKAFTLR
jgi:hypothetical protein